MCLPWPPQSPDLNPIENLWKILKDNIEKGENFPRSTAELKVALEREWTRLSPALLFNLVNSMQNRVKLVLKAKGGPTKY